jgi:ABC-2 type transport system ATP-binding protein
MEYVLKTNALSKNYKHFKALNGLTMNVPKGAIYGFVGKNGAGKTTLIRLICGLQTPSSGDYTLYGCKNTEPEAKVTQARRRMGAVVEMPSIYLDMTAKDNLKQQYRILGLPSFDSIDGLLRLVGLGDTGKKVAKNFSLGMRQRLGIAIALAGDPDFLVLDEPVNGLDPQGIIEIRELILKLNKENQITFLISSHILDELAKLATHYGFIDSGHMVKEISAAQLEATCRKCVRMEVSDIKALARVLDERRIEYKILSGMLADVYAKVNISQLAAALAEEKCEIISMQERDESLESYYVNLVSAGGNAGSADIGKAAVAPGTGGGKNE